MDYNNQKQYRQHKHQQDKNNQKTKMKKKQRNNCRDITSDKRAKSHKRKLRHGSEKETLREKLLIAAESVRTNYANARIDKTQ